MVQLDNPRLSPDQALCGTHAAAIVWLHPRDDMSSTRANGRTEALSATRCGGVHPGTCYPNISAHEQQLVVSSASWGSRAPAEARTSRFTVLFCELCLWQKPTSSSEKKQVAGDAFSGLGCMKLVSIGLIMTQPPSNFPTIHRRPETSERAASVLQDSLWYALGTCSSHM